MVFLRILPYFILTIISKVKSNSEFGVNHGVKINPFHKMCSII